MQKSDDFSLLYRIVRENAIPFTKLTDKSFVKQNGKCHEIRLYILNKNKYKILLKTEKYVSDNT